MTVRNLAIALVTAGLMAWTIQARAQHSGPPGRSPEEECQRECHVRHCDQFVACLGTPDVVVCRRNVTQEEVECMKKCAPGKM